MTMHRPTFQTPHLSVVAPCFNEEAGLREFYRRMTGACTSAVKDDYEIVLINDGSRDGTWSIMCDLALHDPKIVAINFSRNYGHQLALTAGLQYCRGSRILIIDSDLQDPPELLGEMLRVMDDENADVVYGQRRQRAGETLSKRLTAAMFYRTLQYLIDIDIPVDAGDFRLMSRRALDVLNAMPEHHRFMRGMVSWIGFRQVPFLYDRDARFAGVTGYPLSRMIRFGLDAITSFSIAPLHFASGLGILFGLGGLFMLSYTLGSWLVGRTVAGWTSLMIITLIIGSVQLIVFGVLGEYLGRLYMEAKRRPLYVIESVVRQERQGGFAETNIVLGEPVESAGLSADSGSSLRHHGRAQ
jgi:glycosyltransferase involved in cell wall biosynthesis